MTSTTVTADPSAAGDADVVIRPFRDGAQREADIAATDDVAWAALSDAGRQFGFSMGERDAERIAWARSRIGWLVDTDPEGSFVAEQDGIVVFYMSRAGDPLLVHRPESHHDGAIPSGAAIAVHALLRLGLVAGDDGALELAAKYLTQRLTGTTGVKAWATSALLGALDFYIAHRHERLDQVRAALAELAAEPHPEGLAADELPRKVVEIVYTDVDPVLWGAAELSVRAQLAYLQTR